MMDSHVVTSVEDALHLLNKGEVEQAKLLLSALVTYLSISAQEWND